MAALSGRASSIFANPYGGADQNDINENAAGLETAGGRDARVLYEQDFRNRQLERMDIDNRRLDPRRKVMDDAAVADYSVGRWNSPQGYNEQQYETQKFASDWTRKAPERQYNLELSDIRSPYGQAARGMQAMRHENSIALKELMQSGAMDLMDAKSRNDLMSRIIMGQFSNQNAYTNQVGGMWRAGVGSGQTDPSTAVRGFGRDMANAPKIPWSKLVEYSRENKIPLNQVLAEAQRDFEIEDDEAQAAPVVR